MVGILFTPLKSYCYWNNSIHWFDAITDEKFSKNVNKETANKNISRWSLTESLQLTLNLKTV